MSINFDFWDIFINIENSQILIYLLGLEFMKVAKKTVVLLFFFSIILKISTVQAATPDWGIEGGDFIAWDAYFLQNNTDGISEWSWRVGVSIDGFPKSDGKYYINGSLYENETITRNVELNQITLGDLGPFNGFFIGPVLDYDNINSKLISDSSSIDSMRSGINTFIGDYPYYTLTEPVSSELFNITGSGIDGNYIWEYSGVINYSNNKVLNSVNESYSHNDTRTGFFEQKEYRWKMAYYAHCLCGERPPKFLIPGFPLMLLVGTLLIGTVVLVRKYRPILQLIT